MSREQSIEFLRSLKGRPEGVTIYEDTIADVLAALDEAEEWRALVESSAVKAADAIATERLGRIAELERDVMTAKALIRKQHEEYLDRVTTLEEDAQSHTDAVVGMTDVITQLRAELRTAEARVAALEAALRDIKARHTQWYMHEMRIDAANAMQDVERIVAEALAAPPAALPGKGAT